MGAQYSSQYTSTGDLCTMSYTRTNGKGAVESRITCKNCLDGTVSSLLTFSDGVGHCFTQEWGPHVGDENGCGDNTDDTTPPKDGFNCEDYSYLPNGWTDAVILSGSGVSVGSGLVTANGGYPLYAGQYSSYGGCNTGCNTGCAVSC